MLGTHVSINNHDSAVQPSMEMQWIVNIRERNHQLHSMSAGATTASLAIMTLMVDLQRAYWLMRIVRLRWHRHYSCK